MPKKIVITGSSGFVGSHFVDHILKNTDWDVIGIDSFRHRGDSLRVQKNPRYQVFVHDLIAPISHRLAMKMGPPDYVVNFASESHVDRSIEDPVPFIKNNVDIALNMVEYCRIVHPDKFIQISTDEVYGAAPDGVFFKEWSEILPSNPYAASKAAQEAICIGHWRAYGVPLILINCMNLVGEYQDNEKYLPLVIGKLHRGDTLTIHGNKDYIGKRTYIHARNLADGILFLLNEIHPVKFEQSLTSVIKPSRFNICGEKELNNLEVAQAVAEIMGKPLKYELVDFHLTRPGHDMRYGLDGSKIHQAGWKQPFTLEESLGKMIKWYLDNPEWL